MYGVMRGHLLSMDGVIILDSDLLSEDQEITLTGKIGAIKMKTHPSLTLMIASLSLISSACDVDNISKKQFSSVELEQLRGAAQSSHRCALSVRSTESRQKNTPVDCQERSDTGYQNGQAFPISVVLIEGEPAERESANAYWVMKQAALADGVELLITSAFRTWDEQQYLYNCYQNQNCNQGNLAAPPGYSNHQSGHAFDLNTGDPGVLTWLRQNASQFGFEETVASEPWHWEWWGGGPGGGPCQGQPCQLIDAQGAVIDNSGLCFQKFGSPTYWREVSGQGEMGSFFWTNAFDAAEPSNWARWHLHFAEAGEYHVEVSVSAEYGRCTETPYLLKHNGQETAITHDQSRQEYWQSLGHYSFSSGGSQYLDVYDNIPGWTLEDQHIAVDAIRLTRVLPDPDPDMGGEEAGGSGSGGADEEMSSGTLIMEPEETAGMSASEVSGGSEDSPPSGGIDLEEGGSDRQPDGMQAGSDLDRPEASAGQPQPREPSVFDTEEMNEMRSKGGPSCEQGGSMYRINQESLFLLIFLAICFCRYRLYPSKWTISRPNGW